MISSYISDTWVVGKRRVRLEVDLDRQLLEKDMLIAGYRASVLCTAERNDFRDYACDSRGIFSPLYRSRQERPEVRLRPGLDGLAYLLFDCADSLRWNTSISQNMRSSLPELLRSELCLN